MTSNGRSSETGRPHSDDGQTSDGSKPRFHGRRQGRPLRKGRARLIEELLPRLRIDVPNGGTVNPASLFDGQKKEFWLEIGFGAGEHLAWQAEAHPEVGFLGCEVFINGVASLLRHVDERSLGNVRVYNEDANALLGALPDASLTRLFLLHPDPWPKYRHAARRFVQHRSIQQFASRVAGGGELRIATDHPVYLGWTLRIMAGQPWFDWTARSAKDWLERSEDWPQTRYEAKAIREGRRCTYLRYIRNSQPAG